MCEAQTMSTYIGPLMRSITYMSVETEVYSQVYSNCQRLFHGVYLSWGVEIGAPISMATKAHVWY
jgi:hypothetical protein